MTLLLTVEVEPDGHRTHHLTASGQVNELVVLLDALDGVVISDVKRVSLTWLAGIEACTVENIAAVITRAGWAREGGQ
ncbi:MAG: hypothetical protein M3460_15595 [Actinomycetota bacterium]|nr:hypothetical protein [Actinomycetota bacterium]